MESKYSLSTKVTTVVVVLFTLAIVILMDDNEVKDLLAGVWLIGCLLFFAVILSVRGVADYKSKVIYEVK
jgi:uncharacterized membrane protein